MMKRAISIALTAMVIVAGLCSCNRTTKPSAEKDATDSIVINGLTITYPKAFDRDDLSIRQGNVVLKFKEHQLEVVDGILKFDGSSFGPVRNGDQIVLQPDGAIQVNSDTIGPQ